MCRSRRCSPPVTPTTGAGWSGPRRPPSCARVPRRAKRRACRTSSPASPALPRGAREPYLAFGTPGGDQQDQWSLLFFLNHLTFGMNLQQAIDFPSFHTAHMPSSFYPRAAQPRALDVESRVSAPVIEELRRRGHLVSVRPAWSLGRVSAVARRDGVLYAAANPRGMQGYAVGRSARASPGQPAPAP